MQKRKRAKHTKRLVSTQGKARARQALTELARHARGVAHLGGQLQTTATRVEALIDRLAPHAGCTVDDVYAPLRAEARRGHRSNDRH